MEDTLRRLRPALYLVALVFMLIPFVDVAAISLPYEPTSIRWRFTSTGIASNYLISPIFGAMLASIVVALGGHKNRIRIVAAFCGISAAIFLVVGMGLILDTLQWRNEIPSENLQMFYIASTKAFFKYFMTALTFGLLGWSLFRLARGIGKVSSSRLMEEE